MKANELKNRNLLGDEPHGEHREQAIEEGAYAVPRLVHFGSLEQVQANPIGYYFDGPCVDTLRF